MSALLSLQGVGKRYGGVAALEGVDLEVHAGEVLAVCGDNGAGKSSLIRIMSGAQRADAGTMALRGEAVVFRSPHDALVRGVATIYQELALAPRMSVYENVFMGSELVRFGLLDKRRMRREAQAYLARLSVHVADTRRPVEGLSGGQRQAVAISRALRWGAEVIIMDEPTAALGVRETAQVLELVRALKREGRTVVLVSHDMRDVAALADRVCILRAGRKVVDEPLGGRRAEDLVALVMGGGVMG